MPPIPTQNPGAPEAEDESGSLDAVNAGVQKAAEDPEQEKMIQAERDAVKARWKEYTTARDFDKRARSQYAVDRRYAAGNAIISWAVSANLIGAFIDILVSFLYARNPDVSIKKSPKIETAGTQQMDDFALTSELVVSSLWKNPQARMKHHVREQIRSILSVGIGWLKCVLVCKGQNIPQMQQELNDSRDVLMRLEQLRREITPDESGANVVLDDNNEVLSEAELNAKVQKYNALVESQSKRIEVAMRKMLAIDFVSAEDIQVSLDVRSLADYPNANWIANRIYRPISSLQAMFPGVKKEALDKATHYYQRNIGTVKDLSDNVKLTGLADESVQPEEADQYVSSDKAGGTTNQESGIPFACIVELWDNTDEHVYTMIDGVDVWAKQPYQPDYPTTRFYPYFGAGFYPVDGGRHPQSLSWRLRELMDEYCSVRSNKRLVRARAVPGTVFNKALIKPEDAAKLERSTQQELVGIELPPEASVRDAFAEKPIAIGDMRLYETDDILSDMERLSGVQEALQSSIQTEKTATEAEIQQSGFAARTTADRDVIETVLTELAQYTLEAAVTALDAQDAQRIAGPKAFWPTGMSVDDLLSMVEVSIEAGTTGKPKSAQDKTAWSTLLPVLMDSIMKIRQAQIMGDIPTATALTETVKETMRRMGDESDVSRFIPQMTAPPVGPPGMPGGPGAPMPPGGGPPPPAAPAGPGAPVGPPPGAPPVGPEGDLGAVMAPPDLAPPDLVPPELTPPM